MTAALGSCPTNDALNFETDMATLALALWRIRACMHRKLSRLVIFCTSAETRLDAQYLV